MARLLPRRSVAKIKCMVGDIRLIPPSQPTHVRVHTTRYIRCIGTKSPSMCPHRIYCYQHISTTAVYMSVYISTSASHSLH